MLLSRWCEASSQRLHRTDALRSGHPDPPNRLSAPPAADHGADRNGANSVLPATETRS